MNGQRQKNVDFGLLTMLSFVVFCSVLVNACVAALTVYILERNGVFLISEPGMMEMDRMMAQFAIISVPVGILIALVAGKVSLKPIRDLIDGMDRLACGDYQTRVNVGAVMRRYPGFVEAAKSFNKMAEQLQNTEMLRADFINNFSHEFKTPIVSIAGFARLLRKGKLSPERQQEYLEAIEEESLRLSVMATNVLNLTRIENQTILTGVSEFNLSEQIRSCILLLENKWEKKELEFSLSLQDHRIRGNEDLLKQVWLNLLDNAIKFSPQGGLVEIAIEEKESRYRITVRNSGPEIPREKQDKIFNKFYQADESHAAEGNGVGLAIVKRVAELHEGTVQVSSKKGITIFTVDLPKG